MWETENKISNIVTNKNLHTDERTIYIILHLYDHVTLIIYNFSNNTKLFVRNNVCVRVHARTCVNLHVCVR
jgi:hypothetical protein